ncbi:MAG: tetratricopeptide repeat protein [Planctomycetota bacterium]|jgi:tetratricopeptide (TPR) repeat protein
MRKWLVLLFALGCTDTHTVPGEPALLFENLGDIARSVSTDNALAQRYFNQGLALVYGFNHDEAAESFAYAARLDPDCAVAHWGEAYAYGPNYNRKKPSAKYNERALEALARAKRARATAAERGLIDALAVRFASPQPKDRTVLNEAYAKAMKELWRRFPDDDDIGLLYTDALMNLNAWRLWSKNGKPWRHTNEIVATLEKVLARSPDHPAAIHFYIHALEASPYPERAEPAADKLARLAPGSGHLVHMPSHIYLRTGRYRDSVEINMRADAVDRAYFARKQGTQGGYHWYHAHNSHFLVWSAMYAGRYEDALKGCEMILAAIPVDFRDRLGAVEHLSGISHVRIRFGKWEELITAPPPPSKQPFAKSLYHYGRGIGYANTGRFDEARREAAEFEKHAGDIPKDTMNRRARVHTVLGIARNMLAGETAFLSGEQEKGLSYLRRAVELEDELTYQEPSSWMMPARHALGALLLDAGLVDEAETVYRKDLRLHRENGWALHGLAQCLERQGHTEEAAAVRRRFERAWSDATVKIRASCYCAKNAREAHSK